MSKRSKKGFRKLENHELSEFTTLKGEESGSDSEMIEIERDDRIYRRGGGLCCCCLALYVILLSCVVVLLAMTGVYFGSNVMSISNEYRQRIAHLETRVDELENSLSAAGSLSESEMSKMTQRVGGVNDSVLGLAGELKTHSGEVQKELHSVGDSVQDLQDRMAAFESHPPTIGEDEVGNMRNSMAEFHSHLESYDSQLEDVKKTAGDARHQVTKVDQRVQLFERNLTSLRGGLEGVRSDHTETVSNLDLLSLQASALRIVVQEMNETLLQEVNLTRDSINETKEELQGVRERLTDLTGELRAVLGTVLALNSSLDDIVTSIDHVHQSIHELEEAATESPTEPSPVPATQPPTEITAPPTTTQPPPTASTAPPATEESKTAATEPTKEPTKEPTTEPATTEPTTEPATTEPATTEPATEPATTEPATTEPATTESPTAIAASQPTEPEQHTTVTTTQDDSATPLPDSTGKENTTTEPSTQNTPREGGNQTTNEEGLTQSTPAAVLSPPSGTQPVSDSSDSTLATEDIPVPQDRNSSSSTSSGQGSPNDSTPEEQPPTVDRGLEETLGKLNDLLIHFTQLDLNQDDVLEYNEYGGDTIMTQRIFQAIDSDHDYAISYLEILNGMDMLGQQVTVGTEDVPANHEEEGYTDQQPLGTQEHESLTPPSDSEFGATDSGTQPPMGPQATTLPGTAPELTTTVATNIPPPPTDIPPPADEGDSYAGTEDEDEGILSDDESTSDVEAEKMEGALETLTAIQKRFDEFDINSDGRLSNAEFSIYFSSNDQMVASIFRYLDVDGNFFVNRYEISSAIIALREGLPQETEPTDLSPVD